MTEPMKIPFLNKPKVTPDQPQVRGGDTRLQDYMKHPGVQTKDARHMGINGLGNVVNTKPAALMLNPEHRWPEPALQPEEEEKLEQPEERPQTDNIYVDPDANAKEVLRLVPKIPKSNDQEPTRDGH